MPDEQNTHPQSAAEPAANITVTQTPEGGMTAHVEKPDMTAPVETAAQEDTQGMPAEEEQQTLESDFQRQQQTEADVKNDLAGKGLDFDALAAEYDKEGALSAKSLEALEKAGYPKSVIDAYLAGLDALADRYTTAVQSFAGGKEAYGQLVEYLKTQPQNVIDGFNAAIETGNLSQIQLAVTGVKAQMAARYGTANPSIMAGAQGRGAHAGYQTTDEMTKDMADPRYQTDPAFTQEVFRKIQNSTLF